MKKEKGKKCTIVHSPIYCLQIYHLHRHVDRYHVIYLGRLGTDLQFIRSAHQPPLQPWISSTQQDNAISAAFPALLLRNHHIYKYCEHLHTHSAVQSISIMERFFTDNAVASKSNMWKGYRCPRATSTFSTPIIIHVSITNGTKHCFAKHRLHLHFIWNCCMCVCLYLSWFCS